MEYYGSSKRMTKRRIELLQDLGRIVAQCYNGNIQNYGPGGVYEGSGRGFRYPIKGTGSTMKLNTEPTDEEIAAFLSSYCAFGANSMPIYHNLDQVLRFLEGKYGLDVDSKDE